MTTDIADLPDLVGVHLGYTDWQVMSQERVNRFADATNDLQFIHVDPERANDTPFGGTIAHGFLTLSLIASVGQQLLRLRDAKMGINYGLDRVRFPAPLPAGGEWRVGAEISQVDETKGGAQIKMLVTVEVKGSEKPAAVAESLSRVYG
jgi:acyl dehydratase